MSFKMKISEEQVDRMRQTGFLQFVSREELEEKSKLYGDVIDFLKERVTLTTVEKARLNVLLEAIRDWHFKTIA